MVCSETARMHWPILIFLLMARAEAGCELQVTAGNKSFKAPLTQKSVNSEGSQFQATAGGFIAVVTLNREDRTLYALVTNPTTGPFEFRMTASDFIEELDCFGGSAEGSRFRFKCDSREWRALKTKNGWESWCTSE